MCYAVFFQMHDSEQRHAAHCNHRPCRRLGDGRDGDCVGIAHPRDEVRVDHSSKAYEDNQVYKKVLMQGVKVDSQANMYVFRINNAPVLKKTPMRTGADGIALSGDKQTLYWTNLTGNVQYALDTALLRDFNTSEEQLRTAVKRVATLPSNTDGMVSDRDGNLFMSALQLDGVMLLDAKTGQVSTYVSHPEMSWEDTLGWGPDGSLYLTSNHLHLWVDGEMDFDNSAVPNFRIWKIPAGRHSYTQER